MGFWDELSSLGKTLQNVTADLAKKSEEYAASPIHTQQYKKDIKNNFDKVVEYVKGEKDISEINIYKVEELLPNKMEYQKYINDLIINKNRSLINKYKEYMEVEYKALNILCNLIKEKYGDKVINNSDLNILNFHKIELENETKLLNQDIKKFEISPSTDHLKALGERCENLFSNFNKTFFSIKKILLEKYPEISIS